mmetsp:Transcript_6976/g.15268  ORF Transcript_6976/g.15268 Transcript_6976/m.15268 type:complete len:1272 (+) Transcript_6976:48-3863(+)
MDAEPVDEDFELRVVEFASLVECDVETCRSALQRAHGNFDLAVRFIFKTPTSPDGAQQLPVVVDDDTMDLPPVQGDVEEEEHPAKRARRLYYMASPPTSEATQVPATSPSSSSGGGSGSSGSSCSPMPAASPPAPQNQIIVRPLSSFAMPSARPPEASAEGISGFVEISPSESWTTPPGEVLPNVSAWKQEVWSREPPCLKLKDYAGMSSYSSGEMREKKYDRAMISKVCGDRVQLRCGALKKAISSLVDRVRFPPATVEFAWRVHDLRELGGPSLINPAPADLRGKLPPRPFKLLNNRDDPLAEQPRLFRGPQLRQDQLRSLSWMLDQEGHSLSSNTGVACQHQNEGNDEGTGCFEVDWRSFWTDDRVTFGLERGAKVKFTRTAGADARNVDTGRRAENPADLPSSSGTVLRTESGGSVVVDFDAFGTWECHIDDLRMDFNVARPPTQDHMVEARARACYKVRGGLLCDSIGYGKTATMIGLISSTLDAELPPIPEIDKGSFIPAKGTLIIVPSNLLKQWLSEFAKFACPLKIFAMTNVTPLNSATAGAVASADVVLCSYRLLFSEVYCSRRRGLVKAVHGMVAGRESQLMAIATLLRKLGGYEPAGTVPKDVYANSPNELMFPLLEMFYWRRIVFDEFHELEGMESKQQKILQHMRSHYRWGLTGTPPIGSNAGVIFMSSLFRVDLTGHLNFPDRPRGPRSWQVGLSPDLNEWEEDKLLAETAGRFLDRFARQNTAELPHVRLQNHVIYVRHTLAERALYLGQAHDAPDFAALGDAAFASEEGANAIEKLLKLCSHFQAVGDHVTNAKEECQRIGEQKEKQVTRARLQVERLSRLLHIMEHKVKTTSGTKAAAWRKAIASQLDTFRAEGSGSAIGGRVAAEVEQLLACVARETPEHRLAGLDGLHVHNPALQEYLGQAGPRGGHTREQWETFAGTSLPSAALTEVFELLSQQQVQNIVALRDSVVSLEFFQQTLRTVRDDATPESRSCSVCLDDGLPLSRLAITPCAHTFCVDCLKAIVKKYAACSICRKVLQTKDVRPIEVELRARNDGGTAGAASSSSATASAAPTDCRSGSIAVAAASSSSPPTLKADARFGRYGTKLAVLVRKLEQIRAADATAKVILFVQFDDLKQKVASALRDFNIPAALLHGGVSRRGNIIHDWQNNPTSSAYVLLLSLRESASGTNLTAANHVVFLHPMLASTREQATSFEMQAIGRARRHGQLRDTVHVWRLVTVDTVEEHMTQHQALANDEEVMVEHAAPADPAPATGA